MQLSQPLFQSDREPRDASSSESPYELFRENPTRFAEKLKSHTDPISSRLLTRLKPKELPTYPTAAKLVPNPRPRMQILSPRPDSCKVESQPDVVDQ